MHNMYLNHTLIYKTLQNYQSSGAAAKGVRKWGELNFPIYDRWLSIQKPLVTDKSSIPLSMLDMKKLR